MNYPKISPRTDANFLNEDSIMSTPEDVLTAHSALNPEAFLQEVLQHADGLYVQNQALNRALNEQREVIGELKKHVYQLNRKALATVPDSGDVAIATIQRYAALEQRTVDDCKRQMLNSATTPLDRAALDEVKADLKAAQANLRAYTRVLANLQDERLEVA